jgi:hypothetical protein
MVDISSAQAKYKVKGDQTRTGHTNRGWSYRRGKDLIILACHLPLMLRKLQTSSGSSYNQQACDFEQQDSNSLDHANCLQHIVSMNGMLTYHRCKNECISVFVEKRISGH